MANYCSNCGKELKSKWNFCPYCRTNINSMEPQLKPIKLTDQNYFIKDDHPPLVLNFIYLFILCILISSAFFPYLTGYIEVIRTERHIETDRYNYESRILYFEIYGTSFVIIAVIFVTISIILLFTSSHKKAAFALGMVSVSIMGLGIFLIIAYANMDDYIVKYTYGLGMYLGALSLLGLLIINLIYLKYM